MDLSSKRVLLPTDFSDNAWSAIVYALKLYKDESCIFYLLNSTMMTVSTMSNLSNKLLQTLRDNALKELLELKELAESANANANHEFEIVVSSEDLPRAIERAVKEHHIDIIIMGTNGAKGAKEFLFGSHSIQVVKKVRFCPVLIIPEEYDFVEPKQIAFPTDFTRFYSQKELQPLKDLAMLYNSKIRVVHINVEEKLNDIQEYNMQALKSYLGDFEYSFHWMPDYAKKATEIIDFIKELEIDSLATVYYKHSFI